MAAHTAHACMTVVAGRDVANRLLDLLLLITCCLIQAQAQAWSVMASVTDKVTVREREGERGD